MTKTQEVNRARWTAGLSPEQRARRGHMIKVAAVRAAVLRRRASSDDERGETRVMKRGGRGWIEHVLDGLQE